MTRLPVINCAAPAAPAYLRPLSSKLMFGIITTSHLFIGLASAGLWLIIQFIRMVSQGRKIKADKWFLIGNQSMLRFVLPYWVDIPGVVQGLVRPVAAKYSDYQRLGKDGFIQVSMTSPEECVVFIADPQAYKEVTRMRAPFVRDLKLMGLVGTFGDNLLTIEGEEWKHHRKIAQRAFTEKTPQLVWTETCAVLEQLFDLWDQDHGPRVHVPHILEMTKTLTLMIISSAALGFRLSWIEAEEEPWPGYEFSFQKTVRIVSESLIEKSLTPDWATKLTERTRSVDIAHTEFNRYLHQMVDANRRGSNHMQSASKIEANSTRASGNVFDVLVAASDEDAVIEGKGLADTEVVGNAFLFLFAGHETTASAVAFALGFMALYPDIQKDVYKQIKEVMGSRSRLELDDVQKLNLVSGTFLETMRIYPSVSQIFRIASEDTTLSIARNGPGSNEFERETIFVPAGSQVVAHIAAIHFHPAYWPEPEEFRPSRFSGAYNRDAYLPFSIGGKACIGQRFAETEGIAALACILARYEVSIDTALFPEIPGETRQARQARFLKPKHYVSVLPQNIPLVFTRRK